MPATLVTTHPLLSFDVAQASRKHCAQEILTTLTRIHAICKEKERLHQLRHCPLTGGVSRTVKSVYVRLNHDLNLLSGTVLSVAVDAGPSIPYRAADENEIGPSTTAAPKPTPTRKKLLQWSAPTTSSVSPSPASACSS